MLTSTASAGLAEDGHAGIPPLMRRRRRDLCISPTASEPVDELAAAARTQRDVHSAALLLVTGTLTSVEPCSIGGLCVL